MKNKTDVKKIIRSLDNIMDSMADGDELYPRLFDLKNEFKIYYQKFNDKNI